MPKQPNMHRWEKRHCKSFHLCNLVVIPCLAMIKKNLNYHMANIIIINTVLTRIINIGIKNPRITFYCFLCASSIWGQMLIASITLMLTSGLEAFSEAMEKLRSHSCSTLNRAEQLCLCSMGIRTVIMNDKTESSKPQEQERNFEVCIKAHINL